MIVAFLIVCETANETRLHKELDYFERELKAFAEKLVKFHTSGPVPSVEVVSDSYPPKFQPQTNQTRAGLRAGLHVLINPNF